MMTMKQIKYIDLLVEISQYFLNQKFIKIIL
jgi:hypothetical protein